MVFFPFLFKKENLSLTEMLFFKKIDLFTFLLISREGGEVPREREKERSRVRAEHKAPRGARSHEPEIMI